MSTTSRMFRHPDAMNAALDDIVDEITTALADAEMPDEVTKAVGEVQNALDVVNERGRMIVIAFALQRLKAGDKLCALMEDHLPGMAEQQPELDLGQLIGLLPTTKLQDQAWELEHRSSGRRLTP